MATGAELAIDTAALKAQFPLLSHAHPELTYLDSAATTQKPQQVIDAMTAYYENANANVARGVYALAEHATTAMEAARKTVAAFIGSPRPEQVIFTKNATESLNLVAQTWGRQHLGPGDCIAISIMEHHANIVPWQILAAERGFEIRWIEATPEGELDLGSFDQAVRGAKLVALTAMSNVLGTINPIAELIARAHDHGALVSLDACQYVPHHTIDLADLDADFASFSAHKMCGPTGLGVFWGRLELLTAMPPFLGGGGMITNVTREGFTPAELPAKFEAGTPPIAEAIGFGAAIDFLNEVGMDHVMAHERRLVEYALEQFAALGSMLTLHGSRNPERRAGVFSFAVEGVHPHDLSQLLNERGVCVRAGHHCAKPLLRTFNAGATARASTYLYNDESDIDRLIDALNEAHRFFSF